MPINTTVPTPRCGFCNAQGINYLEAKTVGFYAVIYCAKCGAIHGVVPAPPQPAAKPEAPKPEVKPEILTPKPDPKLTPARAQAMAAHYIQPGSTLYHVIRRDDEET